IPTALEAGRYTSNGFQLSRHLQYVRAIGLPLPSTWASAASSSGVMTAMECLAKSGPYCRQVCAGALTSEQRTGKNASVGFRATAGSEIPKQRGVTRYLIAPSAIAPEHHPRSALVSFWRPRGPAQDIRRDPDPPPLLPRAVDDRLWAIDNRKIRRHREER